MHINTLNDERTRRTIPQRTSSGATLVPLTYMHILHSTADINSFPAFFCSYMPVWISQSQRLYNNEEYTHSKVSGDSNKLATFLSVRCVFVLTCFSAVRNHTEAAQTHNALMLVLFHFPASLPITVTLNKERDRKSDIESRGGQ